MSIDIYLCSNNVVYKTEIIMDTFKWERTFERIV